MGGTPLFALNLVAWPRDLLSLDLLADVLEGARELADRGGWVAAGGHTVDGPEPMFGQSVTGEADADALLTNRAGKPGDALVLTKALGTGIVATADKLLPASAIEPGQQLAAPYRAAVASMTTLNAAAAAAALAAKARCATDVTGFGLLGHLHKLALASGLAAELDTLMLPVLDGVLELIQAGYVPGGTARNLEFVREHLDGTPQLPLDLLADPQTSGGLLIACSEHEAQRMVARLQDEGHPAAHIGRLVSGHPGRIVLS